MARDRVDQVLLDWDRERPDLDFTPVGVVSRLGRARSYLDAELAAVFARFGLTSADFGVIIMLRRLLAGFESSTTDVAAALGLTLEPAHLARTRRQAVGLSDTAGLLVTDVTAGSAVVGAGIERGDLITALDGTAVTSSVGLAGLLRDLAGRRSVTLTLLRGNDAVTVRLRLPPARLPGHPAGRPATRGPVSRPAAP